MGQSGERLPTHLVSGSRRPQAQRGFYLGGGHKYLLYTRVVPDRYLVSITQGVFEGGRKLTKGWGDHVTSVPYDLS